MNIAHHTFAAVVAATLALGTVPAEAQARGGYSHGGYSHGGYSHGSYSHGGYRGGYGCCGGWGLGIGLGIGLTAAYLGGYYAPYYPYPGYVVVDAPPTTTYVTPAAATTVVAARAATDLVIYPRSGQTAAQTETDRQECNRWATTVPAAMADASVFQRAVAACLEGRGYTVR